MTQKTIIEKDGQGVIPQTVPPVKKARAAYRLARNKVLTLEEEVGKLAAAHKVGREALNLAQAEKETAEKVLALAEDAEGE